MVTWVEASATASRLPSALSARETARRALGSWRAWRSRPVAGAGGDGKGGRLGGGNVGEGGQRRQRGWRFVGRSALQHRFEGIGRLGRGRVARRGRFGHHPPQDAADGG